MTKNIMVIGAENPSPSTQKILDEARQVFDIVDYIPVNHILIDIGKSQDLKFDNMTIQKYDYCLPRIDSKRAQHGYHVMRFLDNISMKKPYSAETILVAHNKFMTIETLKKANVPIPRTYLVSSLKTAKQILKRLKYPIVIKIVDSYGGVGVMVFEHSESALSAVETLHLLKQQLIIEEFIENPGEDYRVMVIGGEVVACMKRKAMKGEDRANVHLGGKANSVKIQPDMEDIALRAAAAVNSDIVAVDLIEGKKGAMVIEVNINPGLQGLQKATNINVAKKIVEFVNEELEK